MRLLHRRKRETARKLNRGSCDAAGANPAAELFCWLLCLTWYSQPMMETDLKFFTSWRRNTCGTIVAVGLLLASCEGRVTADLATEAPADPEVQQVLAGLSGVQFRTSGSGTESIEFTDSELVDLMDYLSGTPLRLLTDEVLPEGTYTGVRLIFDDEEDTRVIRTDGGEVPVVLAEGDYADADFTVEEDERSNESLTLTLDLRQSLRFDDDAAESTLTPELRSVRTDDAGRIEGFVDVDCPSDSSLIQGGAMYLFNGHDVEPDDLDNSDVELYLTTAVSTDAFGTSLVYALRFLPEGDYTIALTCRGDEDDLGDDDDLDFQNVENIVLDGGETLNHDID